jgi:chromosome transmission fidelity protein 4
VACTSRGYVRVYTTQGTPVRLYRQKYMPVVTCASWKNYIMVIGNGGALGDGEHFSLQEVSDDRNDRVDVYD